MLSRCFVALLLLLQMCIKTNPTIILQEEKKKETSGNLQLPFLFLCSATVWNYSTNKKGSSMVAGAANISFLKGDYTEEKRYFGHVLDLWCTKEIKTGRQKPSAYFTSTKSKLRPEACSCCPHHTQRKAEVTSPQHLSHLHLPSVSNTVPTPGLSHLNWPQTQSTEDPRLPPCTVCTWGQWQWGAWPARGCQKPLAFSGQLFLQLCDTLDKGEGNHTWLQKQVSKQFTVCENLFLSPFTSKADNLI